MKGGIGIKLKHSLFLAALLLLTVLALGLLVLRGIRDYQLDRMESALLQQSRMANVSVRQSFLTTAATDAQAFLQSRGRQLAMELATVTGLRAALYDRSGAPVGDSAPHRAPYAVEDALSFALQGKIAYLKDGHSVLYLFPLQGPDGQMGAALLQYSLAADLRFYGTVEAWFQRVGGLVLAASFGLGHLYFNRSAAAVRKLAQAAERIRGGVYLSEPPLNRKDELGRLSQSIYAMSVSIRNHIAAMKREEHKLRRAVDRLQKLEQQQKQFIGNISHEFKTPLTSIKAYVELMDMYKDDEALREDAAAYIAQETERLSDMVEKILRLASLETYEFELQAEPLNVGELLPPLIDRMKAKADRFGVTLRARLQPALIRADRESFGHIVINLLDNAIKYNVPGGHVSVSNSRSGNSVAIVIADSGIGIPPGARDKIFDPFYTANKNRSRQTGGAGLGLALVKQLVEKHRGTIALLDSRAGTAFQITFPAYDAAAPASASASSPTSAPAGNDDAP